MTNILTGVVQRGTGTARGAGAEPADRRQDRHDERLFRQLVRRLHPDIVIAVWLGFDDPRSLGKDETGGQNAAPIFREVLEAALQDSPPVPFRAPPGVALVRMQDGGATILEAFRPGTENSARSVGGKSAGGGTAAGAEQSLGGLY